MGFGVFWGLGVGCGVWGVGCGVWGFEIRVQGVWVNAIRRVHGGGGGGSIHRRTTIASVQAVAAQREGLYESVHLPLNLKPKARNPKSPKYPKSP